MKKKTNKQDDENLIYIRLGFQESLYSKRDILFLEMNSLKTSQSIKRYQEIRLLELEKKIKLDIQIKTILKLLKNCERTLPKLQIPKILQKEKEFGEEIKIKTLKKTYGSDIQSQLQEIQDKLAALQG